MRIRLKFSKHGTAKFIGHLDVMRYFQKVNRRAGIDVSYSGGYSPHQLMSFAQPLSVGATSDGEYLDMELSREADAAEVMARMNAVMHEGMRLLDAETLAEDAENGMRAVAAAAWRIGLRASAFEDTVCGAEGTLSKEAAEAVLRECVPDFFAQPSIPVRKKSKRGERETDLKPLLYRMEAHGADVFLLARAGSTDNVKPSAVMEALLAREGAALPPYALSFHRMELYSEQETADGAFLTPLICKDASERIRR